MKNKTTDNIITDREILSNYERNSDFKHIIINVQEHFI